MKYTILLNKKQAISICVLHRTVLLYASMSYQSDQIKYANRHIKKGLCRDCKSKAEPGKKRCQKHLDAQIKYSTKRKARNRDNKTQK